MNTLAYLASSLGQRKKLFNVYYRCVMLPNFLSLMLQQNKLERLSLAGFLLALVTKASLAGVSTIMTLLQT